MSTLCHPFIELGQLFSECQFPEAEDRYREQNEALKVVELSVNV